MDKFEILPIGMRITFRIDIKECNKQIINGSINNIKNMIIALAGPILNFVIAIIFYYFSLKSYDKIIIQYFIIVIYVNLTIGMFNLIPIYPLDGGRILKDILCICIGKRKTLQTINFISNILVIILTFFSIFTLYQTKNVAILFILVFLWSMIIKENKKYRVLKKIHNLMNKI